MVLWASVTRACWTLEERPPAPPPPGARGSRTRRGRPRGEAPRWAPQRSQDGRSPASAALARVAPWTHPYRPPGETGPEHQAPAPDHGEDRAGPAAVARTRPMPGVVGPGLACQPCAPPRRCGGGATWRWATGARIWRWKSGGADVWNKRNKARVRWGVPGDVSCGACMRVTPFIGVAKPGFRPRQMAFDRPPADGAGYWPSRHT